MEIKLHNAPSVEATEMRALKSKVLAVLVDSIGFFFHRILEDYTTKIAELQSQHHQASCEFRSFSQRSQEHAHKLKALVIEVEKNPSSLDETKTQLIKSTATSMKEAAILSREAFKKVQALEGEIDLHKKACEEKQKQLEQFKYLIRV